MIRYLLAANIMPKVEKDHVLLRSIQTIVEDCNGYGPAAKRLGVDKMTVWRFCTSGRAIERNRARLAAAAKRYESESHGTDIIKRLLHFANPDKVTADDLRAIRNFCQKMIALVDAYEKMNEGIALTHAPSHGLSALADPTVPERGN